MFFELFADTGAKKRSPELAGSLINASPVEKPSRYNTTSRTLSGLERGILVWASVFGLQQSQNPDQAKLRSVRPPDGRKAGRQRGREGGREGKREGGREGGREGERRAGGREGGRGYSVNFERAACGH